MIIKLDAPDPGAGILGRAPKVKFSIQFLKKIDFFTRSRSWDPGPSSKSQIRLSDHAPPICISGLWPWVGSKPRRQ